MIARYGAMTTTSATILIRFCALSGAACYDAICSDDILDYDLGIRNRCGTCDGTTTTMVMFRDACGYVLSPNAPPLSARDILSL